jgi:hypothetical protein
MKPSAAPPDLPLRLAAIATELGTVHISYLLERCGLPGRAAASPAFNGAGTLGGPRRPGAGERGEHVGAQMNGSDDEQHDAHVKCYRIAVAVAYGDAVAGAYDKHLAKAGSTDERDAAYLAYVERVSSAWKDAPPISLPEHLPGDQGAFIRAVTALRECDDIGPLLHFAESGRQLSAVNLTALIRLLHARSLPRRRGQPGKHMRWADPNYVAAWLVEHIDLPAWKREQGRGNVSAADKEEIIKARIHNMKTTWAMLKGKPRALSYTRIAELLRGSKKFRL